MSECCIAGAAQLVDEKEQDLPVIHTTVTVVKAKLMEVAQYLDRKEQGLLIIQTTFAIIEDHGNDANPSQARFITAQVRGFYNYGNCTMYEYR